MADTPGNGRSQDVVVAVLQERVNNLETCVEHLTTKIDAMNGRLNTILGSVVVACILLAIQTLLSVARP